MPFKILVFAALAFFTILPVSKSIAAQSSRHGYDEFDRLKWTQYEDGTVISYDYDKVGNRTVKSTYIGQLLNNLTINAMASGYGSIVPSGTITVASGNNQTFFIEQGTSPTASTCPSGYTFVTANNRCEKTPPGCPSGYTLNGSQCTQLVTSTYQASCSAGQGSLNTGSGQCEYSATGTLTGGTTYDQPIYIGTFGTLIGGPGLICTTANGCYGIAGYASGTSTATATLPVYLEVYNSFSHTCNNINASTGVAIYRINFGYCAASKLYGYISSSNANGTTSPISAVNGNTWGLVASAPTSGYTLYGYVAPSPGIYGQTTIYSCPNGGTLIGTTCQNTPICPSGGTLSGINCYVSTTYTASPTCSNGTYESSTNTCYSYLPGTLTSLLVDNAAVNLATLSSMQGPSGKRYYYTLANVASNHTIIANFGAASAPPCTNYPARLAGATPVNYLSLQAAYNAAANGDTIQGNMYDHMESLSLDRNVSVTLDGGYSCDYSSITGSLTINGNMIISDGNINVESSVVLE
ncbi:hypothetical protein [Geotalea uraniireducens]|nr:hypothetical protein [Geotalea uraniireducens]